MTGAELLARIRRDRAGLDAALEGLSADQQTEPSLDAGWSVKDVLAHISAWERICTRWLEAVESGESPSRPEVADLDDTNARLYDEAKERALTAVLGESRASYAALIATVERLPDTALNDKQPFGFKLWRMIDGNSAEHYCEHAGQIAAWLQAAAS
jgi:uncharacterized damage-inducible protein DinB